MQVIEVNSRKREKAPQDTRCRRESSMPENRIGIPMKQPREEKKKDLYASNHHHSLPFPLARALTPPAAFPRVCHSVEYNCLLCLIL